MEDNLHTFVDIPTPVNHYRKDIEKRECIKD